MLGQAELAQILLPVGELTKTEVRRLAGSCGLRTADKPESQDTCFITATGGREAFLGGRIPLRPGRMIEASSGVDLGGVSAIQLVTVGQRRGLGLAQGGDGQRRYAVAVAVAGSTVTVGSTADLCCEPIDVRDWTRTDAQPDPASPLRAQASASGRVSAAQIDERGITFDVPQRQIAPGQAVVVYDAATGLDVLGGRVPARPAA